MTLRDGTNLGAVRVSRAALARYHERAADAGLGVSAWVRIALDRALDAGRRPDRAPAGRAVISVPEDAVVYRCKLAGGRVVELALPVELSAADAERLCAFLRTQADEAPAAGRTGED